MTGGRDASERPWKVLIGVREHRTSKLCMPTELSYMATNFVVFHLGPNLLFSKPIEIDPVKELSRVAR